MEYTKLVAPTITELFESKIQSAILSGELKTGEKLPTERELAERFGISKSAVHLGLQNLKNAGFISIEPRQGIYVADWAESGGLETLSALLRSNALKLEKSNVRSLINMREALEADAMIALAGKHTEQNIKDLLDITSEIRKGTAAYRYDELTELAFRFTHYIYYHSGNVFSSLILNSFKTFATALWREWIVVIGPEKAADYMEEIARCIEVGDGHAAIAIEHEYHLEFLNRESV